MRSLSASPLLLAALALGASVARAEDARVVAAPGEASGRLDVDDARPEAWRAVAQGALVVPKLVVNTAFLPVRGAAYAYERYQLGYRWKQVFYNDAGTFGIVPAAFYETSVGLYGGARLVHKDLFGAGEQLRLLGGYGGEYRQHWAARLSSGRRFGDVRVTARGEYSVRPHAPFYGLGNGDLVAREGLGENLDAFAVQDVAIRTEVRQHVARGELTVGARLAGPLALEVTTAWTGRRFGEPAGDDATDAAARRFDPATLVGYDRGLTNVYNEVAFVLDTLRVAAPWMSLVTPSTGARVTAFAGHSLGLAARDPSRYLRYGADAVRYFDLYGGDRVLTLRGTVEGVSAPLDRVPFVDLPRLGGPLYLRGYALDRFRDRIAVLGTVEYRWPLLEETSGFLFVDAGRVGRAWDDFGPGPVRVGFGGGVDVHTHDAFVVRMQIAGSSEGVYLQLRFDPTYQTPARTVRT